MATIKVWFQSVKRYAVARKFHFFVLCCLGVLFFIETSQFAMLQTTHYKMEKDELQEYISSQSKIMAEVDSETREMLTKKLETKFATISSRIDIVDSAIKPDEKRRMLIKTVRDAIKDNTDTPVSIRTLNRIAIAVVDNSFKYNLSIAGVLAQMKQESNFNAKAESHAGAKGLMQIIDPTAEEIASKLGRSRYNIWDIETNIEFGCFYMAEMLHVFENDFIYALRAYNFGPHNVKRVKFEGADYGRSVEREVNGVMKSVVADKRGEPELDDEGQMIVVTEDHRYPRETRGYVVNIVKNRGLFAEYGLDKVE